MDDDGDDDESIDCEDDLEEDSSDYNEADASYSENDDDEVDLDDLKTYHDPKNEGEEKDFLNASTADFNKAIKQINQQLHDEGQLTPTEHDDQNETNRSLAVRTIQEETQRSDVLSNEQIDVDNIDVIVPREERSSRYTNR